MSMTSTCSTAYTRVYIQAEAPTAPAGDNLNVFFVRSGEGAMIPISSLGTSHYTTGAGTIMRFNMFNSALVTGEAASGYSSGQAHGRHGTHC